MILNILEHYGRVERLKQLTKSSLDQQLEDICDAKPIKADELQKDKGKNHDIYTDCRKQKLIDQEIKRLERNAKFRGEPEFPYGKNRSRSEYPYGGRR